MKILVKILAVILNTMCFMSMIVGCGDDKKSVSTDDDVNEIRIKAIEDNEITIRENVITENVITEEVIR